MGFPRRGDHGSGTESTISFQALEHEILVSGRNHVCCCCQVWKELTCGMPGRVVGVFAAALAFSFAVAEDPLPPPGMTEEEASFTTSMRPPSMPPAAAPTWCLV